MQSCSISTLPPCWSLQVFILEPLLISSDPLDSLTWAQGFHTLTTSKWASPAQSKPLNSKCAHLAACCTSPLGYLRGILDTKLSWSLPSAQTCSSHKWSHSHSSWWLRPKHCQLKIQPVGNPVGFGFGPHPCLRLLKSSRSIFSGKAWIIFLKYKSDFASLLLQTCYGSQSHLWKCSGSYSPTWAPALITSPLTVVLLLLLWVQSCWSPSCSLNQHHYLAAGPLYRLSISHMPAIQHPFLLRVFT